MIGCLNCGNPVPEGDAKIFAEVFVCPTCHAIASALYNRFSSDMKIALVLLKDILRERLITGKLQLPEQSLETMSHTDVLRMIVRLQEMYDAARNRPGAGDPAQQPESNADRGGELRQDRR